MNRLLIWTLIAGFVASTSDAAELSSLRVESVVLRPMREAEVSAQQSGLLIKIIAGEGKQVKKGQLLASLDARVAELDVERAKLERAQAEAKSANTTKVEFAEKALEVARAELRRSSESIKKFAKSISQSQIDVEQLTVEKLALERRQAQHELTLARFDLQLKSNELAAAYLRFSQHQLHAPFAGVVVLVRGRVGEAVEVGAPVVRLVAVDKLRAEGFVEATQAASSLVGQSVTFQSKQTDQRVVASGVLRFVSPEMDPVTGQVRVWAEIANDQGTLRPGQQGTMEITRAHTDDNQRP